MVQNGKFSAGIPIFVRTLNRVLLPTFGSPTMPICKHKNKVFEGMSWGANIESTVNEILNASLTEDAL